MLRIDSRKASTESQGFDGEVFPVLEENCQSDPELVTDILRRVFRGRSMKDTDAQVAVICQTSTRTARDIIAGRSEIPAVLLAAIVAKLVGRSSRVASSRKPKKSQ